jgi:hypothetical protein
VASTTAPAAVDADTGFPILNGLRAGQPYPPSRDQLMLFGQFVGIWDMDVEYYNQAGECTYHGQWEWSFAWILGGRAIQDVIVRLDPADDGTPARVPGGTTLRYCHPGTGDWTVYYLGIVTGITTLLHGGAVGDTIVLEGPDPDGTQNRWTFSDIRADSFTWTGVESRAGAAWWRNQRMLARRR